MIDRTIGRNGSKLPNQFVWNNTVSEVTTDSLFGITQSYSPRMGVEPTETIAPAAKDFAVIFNKVVRALEKAKLSMKLQADKHWNPALDLGRSRGRGNP